MNIQPFVDAFNAVEVVLWIVLGVIVLYRNRGDMTWKPILLAVAFILFGISDIVELQTGAFWRPWWLLAWKAACIGVFVALFWLHRRNGITKATEQHQDETNA